MRAPGCSRGWEGRPGGSGILSLQSSLPSYQSFPRAKSVVPAGDRLFHVSLTGTSPLAYSLLGGLGNGAELGYDLVPATCDRKTLGRLLLYL